MEEAPVDDGSGPHDAAMDVGHNDGTVKWSNGGAVAPALRCAL